jgi:ketosteroid isomerase-like protein
VTDQDIAVVEAVIAAFNRGDVDEVLRFNHPDGEWVNPDYAIETGTRHGPDELRRALESVMEFFEEVVVESIERAPDGRIFVTSRVRSRGMGSGPGIEGTTGTIYTVRDGLVHRYEWYSTAEEGREAAGL